MTKYLALFLCLTFFAPAQNDSNQKDNLGPGDLTEMGLAKQKLYAGDYLGALNKFRGVEKNNPNNPKVNYYVGFCYFQMQQYANARTSMVKAVQGSGGVPEAHLYMAKLLHMDRNFDEAIAQLNIYLVDKGAEKESLEDGAVLLSQCNNAKHLIANPVDVKVKPLGNDINSKWDDKNPCITADSKKLVFTTRRPETTSSETDIEGDGKYFETIYVSNVDSATGEFGRPVMFGAPINIKAHDAATSISPDGRQLFIYYNDMKDKKRKAGNIFVSKLNNGKWKNPEDLGSPINSQYWEGGVCVSPDGKKYFFTSERKGGYGRSDIWMVTRKSKKEWGEPVNLGPEINSANDEAGMFLAPDGKTLFFCTDGPLSMGSYDVVKTTFENGKWSKPVNVGFPINTPDREGQLTLSADARYAYISSNRAGGSGETDIYKVELNNYAILEKDGQKKSSNGLGILRGTIREGGEGYGVSEVEIIINNNQGALVSNTETNEAGEYFFTLPAGRYQLMIQKKGYKPISEELEISSSEKETPIVEKGYLIHKN